MVSSLFLRVVVPTLVILALAAGCGGSGSTVSGTVTFNGQPVERGYINFYPADGKGAPVGGEIKGGKYTVRNVSPGKNRVDVTSTPLSAGNAPSTMDEGIKAAKDAKRAPDEVGPKDEGNGKEHEIGTGSTELNLTIKTASSSDGKSR